MDCYQDLANAIVQQAAKDYVSAMRKLPDSEKAKKDLRELEAFFHSDWYELLTDVNPDYLIRQLKENDKEDAA